MNIFIDYIMIYAGDVMIPNKSGWCQIWFCLVLSYLFSCALPNNTEKSLHQIKAMLCFARSVPTGIIL